MKQLVFIVEGMLMGAYFTIGFISGEGRSPYVGFVLCVAVFIAGGLVHDYLVKIP